MNGNKLIWYSVFSAAFVVSALVGCVNGTGNGNESAPMDTEVVVKKQWSSTTMHLEGWYPIVSGENPSLIHNQTTDVLINAIEVSLVKLSIPFSKIPVTNASNVLTARSPDLFRHTVVWRITDESIGCDSMMVESLRQGDSRCTIEIHHGGLTEGKSRLSNGPDDDVWLIGSENQLKLSITTPVNTGAFTLTLHEQLKSALPDNMAVSQ